MTPRAQIDAVRQQQLAREQRLAAAVAVLALRAEHELTAFLTEHRHAWATMPPPDQQTLLQRGLIQNLMALVASVFTLLALQVTPLITDAKRQSALAGASDALIVASALGISATLTALTPQEIATLAGRTTTGIGIPAQYVSLIPALQVRLRDTLDTRAAQQWGLRQTQHAVTRDIQLTTREHAVVIARQESWQSYGAGLVRTYQANEDVLSGWTWFSQRDEYTCLSCLMLDGHTFPLETPFAPNHAACRCEAIPIVRDSPVDRGESGEDWFTRQPVATQRAMMGDAAYRLYAHGIITLHDLMQTTTTEQGTFHTVKSLKTLVNDGRITAAQYRAALHP